MHISQGSWVCYAAAPSSGKIIFHFWKLQLGFCEAFSFSSESFEASHNFLFGLSFFCLVGSLVFWGFFGVLIFLFFVFVFPFPQILNIMNSSLGLWGCQRSRAVG